MALKINITTEHGLTMNGVYSSIAGYRMVSKETTAVVLKTYLNKNAKENGLVPIDETEYYVDAEFPANDILNALYLGLKKLPKFSTVEDC
jgi:hypothetical protein